jgi:hypothetical protein
MSNYTKYIYHLFLFLLLALGLPSVEAHQQHVNFTENKGQWLTGVQFKANLDGGALFVEKGCFTYHFYNKTALHKNHLNKTKKQLTVNTHAFKMNFVNANSNVTFQKSDKIKSHQRVVIRRGSCLGLHPHRGGPSAHGRGEAGLQRAAHRAGTRPIHDAGRCDHQLHRQVELRAVTPPARSG